ncbi:hypothetical protein M0812_05207 [Anaeramoeba flamelloides]|uniref:Uncharacterized protein n=1 Tax=Anaeramoeba flamelloides TaxID=1746091 RepID=A0AAV8A438_9EUKA|nr:hypothetical protein M0812_05207 [Anaeramoeba flamelloides]
MITNEITLVQNTTQSIKKQEEKLSFPNSKMSNIKSLGDINGIKKRIRLFETLDTIKTFPEEVTKIDDVVAEYDNNIVFLSSEGKLYQSTAEQYP